MLYSRAGTYPAKQAIIYAEGFSPNTPEGACPTCSGLRRVYDATEASMVLDASLTIRQRAIAAWPLAWHPDLVDTWHMQSRIKVFKVARQRRNHSEAFKAEVVRLVLDGGKSVAEAARAHELANSVVSSWVKRGKIEVGQGPAGALTTRELRIERDFLKIARRGSRGKAREIPRNPRPCWAIPGVLDVPQAAGGLVRK